MQSRDRDPGTTIGYTRQQWNSPLYARVPSATPGTTVSLCRAHQVEYALNDSCQDLYRGTEVLAQTGGDVTMPCTTSMYGSVQNNVSAFTLSRSSARTHIREACLGLQSRDRDPKSSGLVDYRAIQCWAIPEHAQRCFEQLFRRFRLIRVNIHSPTVARA